MVSNDEFARMAEQQGRLDDAFRPFAYQDPDGECIHFIAAPESYYGERVDGMVTVYRGHESKKIVGSQIKGIKGLMRRHPGLVIDIKDGKVRLHHVLRAGGWATEHAKGDVSVFIYRKLVQLAEQTGAEVELVGT